MRRFLRWLARREIHEAYVQGYLNGMVGAKDIVEEMTQGWEMIERRVLEGVVAVRKRSVH